MKVLVLKFRNDGFFDRFYEELQTFIDPQSLHLFECEKTAFNKRFEKTALKNYAILLSAIAEAEHIIIYYSGDNLDQEGQENYKFVKSVVDMLNSYGVYPLFASANTIAFDDNFAEFKRQTLASLRLIS